MGIDADIAEGIQEYHEYKHPEFDKEYGWRLTNTLFDIGASKKEKLEDFEDNTPLDEEGNLCVDRFWDRKTGQFKKDAFFILKKHPVNNKTYTEISIPGTNKTFIVDFENKINFPGFEKGSSKCIHHIDSFGDKEIIICGGFDDVECIDSEGKQIGYTCIGIKKIKHGNIDILEFRSWVNPNYGVNDMRTKTSYLGSDGKRYRPKFSPSGDLGTISFEEISEVPST